MGKPGGFSVESRGESSGGASREYLLDPAIQSLQPMSPRGRAELYVGSPVGRAGRNSVGSSEIDHRGPRRLSDQTQRQSRGWVCGNGELQDATSLCRWQVAGASTVTGYGVASFQRLWGLRLDGSVASTSPHCSISRSQRSTPPLLISSWRARSLVG